MDGSHHRKDGLMDESHKGVSMMVYNILQVKERKGGVVGIYQLTNLCVILVCVTHVYRTQSV